MLENNGCVQTHYIDGVNPNNLKYVEIVDLYDTGEYKWFVKDSFDNTTPVFDNLHEFITIDDKSCMFLGSYNGNTKLFVVEGSQSKTNKIYNEYELDENPKKLLNIDSKHGLVVAEKGMYFLDKQYLKRCSDIFDNIINKVIDGKNLFIFEKEVKDNDRNISKKIIGTIELDGRIGDFVYDESVNVIRSTPKINVQNSYDLLNTSILDKELDELYLKKKMEKNDYIKKLSRINK